MRIYIIGNDGITLSSSLRATVKRANCCCLKGGAFTPPSQRQTPAGLWNRAPGVE